MSDQPPPPLFTPLVQALIADRKIEKRLARTATRRIGSAADGEDAARHVIEIVLKREREKYCWNPKGPWSFQKYMFRTLRGVLSTDGRAAENDPDIPTEDLEPLAGSTHPDDVKAEQAERLELEALADETERLVAEDSQGAIPLAMLKAATEQDYEDHTELAARVGCSLEDIRKGQRRITKYAAKLVEAFRVKKRRGNL
jgi:DNA-directed RNA polymerase specialized sigma24 family protein